MSGISIRLTHKVMAIGLFGLIGLVAFGTIYQIGSLSQDTSRDAAEDARRLSDLNQRISQQLLEARRAEKDFQLRRDQSYAKRHAELASDITRNLDRLGSAARAAGYAAVGEKASLVRTGFERYVSEFAAVEQAEVRLGLNETLGLSGSLRTAVHGIETKLKEVDDPRLTSGMLTMRRHEKDFMLRRDPKYLDALKKTATEFSGQVEASAIPPAVKADIGKKLSKYQDDFVAWAAGAQDLTAHGSAMSKEFRTIEPVLDEIEKTVSQQYDAARAAEESMRASIKLWMWVALGCSILLVGSVSFFTGRSISTALIAMVRAMTGLAKGDMSVAIPGVGRKDEIGEMAGAVEVFRSNMAEADRLRAEQAEADARRREQRKFDMQRLADTFEGAVGEIIETVSSAATELEASSNTLTHAAERGNSLATAVAAASEEASANVQSVSSASEELTSSVSEISRQVQESARVADVAVGQAQRTNCARRRADQGRFPHRRRRRTDQHHRRADQPPGAQRDDRGGAGGRSRQGLCGGRDRSEGSCRADRESHRRNRSAHRRDPVRDRRIRRRDQGDRRHHRADVGDLVDHRCCGGGTGRRHAGDLPQHPARRARYFRGFVEHRRRPARLRRDRGCLGAGAFGRAVAVAGEQPAQERGRALPGIGAGGLRRPPPGECGGASCFASQHGCGENSVRRGRPVVLRRLLLTPACNYGAQSYGIRTSQHC
ncbi:methyl-accepting chemotaxis protein [Bradyrhizobium ottawaense]